MKKILFILMIISMIGCKQMVPIDKDDESVIKEESFDGRNILTFDIKQSEIKLETRVPMYDVLIHNNGSNDVKNVKVLFSNIKKPQPRIQLHNVIRAESSEFAAIFSHDPLGTITIIGYYYTLDRNKQIYVDLTKQVYQYKEYYSSTDTTEGKKLPLVPNNAFTYFAWKNKGEWYFDYLPGLEISKRDLAEMNYWPNPMSVVEALAERQKESYFEGVFYHFQNLEGEMSKELEDLIKQSMEYQDYEYAIQSDQKKISELSHKYPYMVTVGIYTNEYQPCDIEYCATIFNYSQNTFSFTDQEVSQRGQKSYNVTEIIDILNENVRYDAYVTGIKQELNKAEIAELKELFRNVTMSILYQNGGPIGADKPVIYLYPEKTMQVHVEVDYHGILTTTYPKYDSGWDVIASPNGSLLNIKDGKAYSYLFWEGTGYVCYPMNKGFVISKDDTVAFLQEKLAFMGLLPSEYNEFIVFWLPLLNQHDYNVITFQTEAYTSIAKLKISPTPDSQQRIFMAFKGLEAPIEIEEQLLQSFNRSGFTVIEWGGVEIK